MGLGRLPGVLGHLLYRVTIRRRCRHPVAVPTATSTIEGRRTQRSFGRRAKVVFAYGRHPDIHLVQVGSPLDCSLFFSMTRQYPEWRNDRDAQLHGSLVLYTGLIGKVRWPSSSVRFSCSWYSSRCRAHEMGGVNFDPFTPFGTHLPQSEIGRAHV